MILDSQHSRVCLDWQTLPRLLFVQLFLLLLPLSLSAFGQSDNEASSGECQAIERLVPPLGMEIPAARREQWLQKIQAIEQQLESLPNELRNDVRVLTKACRYAIEFRELYREQDFKRIDRLLELATERLAEPTQVSASRRIVRGFESKIDGAVQPAGIVLPENYDAKKSYPLYVWLHGRGDKATDLHFICERLDKDGQITPPNAIVLHPFGRQCIGYKSAGETDVLEAIDFACREYPIAKDKIVLMGFSMGGAGVWHLAAHYSDRFIAASPGAGFAETARYQKLKPSNFPPVYEQMLWSIYDVPGYTRNLFNLPIVAYSGENDKQIQAARVMEEAFEKEGRRLTHLIGPGMGHEYYPDTLAEILSRMDQAVRTTEVSATLQNIFIQTKHLRYGSRGGVIVDGMIDGYADTRCDLEFSAASGGKQTCTITTKNVSRLELPIAMLQKVDDLSLDGQRNLLDLNTLPSSKILLSRNASGQWVSTPEFPAMRKHPGLSGPIDDAFLDPFLVVVPSSKSHHPQVEHWVQCELRNFEERWQSLFRGEIRKKLDTEVTAGDIERYNLVLWGDPTSNRMLQKMFSNGSLGPYQWDQQKLAVADEAVYASDHILLGCYPNPLNQKRYVVFNSGPTFRQAHDRTNSLQNPHLPDWAMVSLSQEPNAESPGRIVRAGFLDQSWRFSPELSFGSE